MKRAKFTAVMASNGVEAIEAIRTLEKNQGKKDGPPRFDVVLVSYLIL